jgi:hypothetical protein
MINMDQNQVVRTSFFGFDKFRNILHVADDVFEGLSRAKAGDLVMVSDIMKRVTDHHTLN